VNPACSGLGPWARYRPADDPPLALLPFPFGIGNPRREILYRRLAKITGMVGGLVIFGVGCRRLTSGPANKTFALTSLREPQDPFSCLKNFAQKFLKDSPGLRRATGG